MKQGMQRQEHVAAVLAEAAKAKAEVDSRVQVGGGQRMRPTVCTASHIAALHCAVHVSVTPLATQYMCQSLQL